MTYLVVALPEDETLEELHTIRDYFYQNNFRYHNKPVSDKAHITLAKVSNISNGFIQSLTKAFKDTKSFTLSSFLIYIQEHKRIYDNPEYSKEYPNGCGWFTLLFQGDQNLLKISKKIMDIANDFGINESFDYVQNIIKMQNVENKSDLNIYDYIANHMNICNYIRLEKMNEAKKIFENRFKYDRIRIDKIGLRNEKGNIIEEIKLGN